MTTLSQFILYWCIAVLPLALTASASVDSHRQNGEAAGDTKLYSNLIYVHAIFMTIAFVFLIPAAIFASRFGRYAMGRRWFATHAALNGIAVCIFLSIAFGVGWVAASPANLTHSHHKLGVIVFTLVFFQLVLGIGIALLHRRSSHNTREKRSITDHFHRWFGRIVLLLAWAQLWDGVLFFGSPLVVYILLGIAQGLILVTYIAMEIKVKDKSPLKPHEKPASEKSLANSA